MLCLLLQSWALQAAEQKRWKAANLKPRALENHTAFQPSLAHWPHGERSQIAALRHLQALCWVLGWVNAVAAGQGLLRAGTRAQHRPASHIAQRDWSRAQPLHIAPGHLGWVAEGMCRAGSLLLFLFDFPTNSSSCKLFSPLPLISLTRSVPLADLVGQPVAVSRIEALPAGENTAPVRGRAVGGAGCAVILTGSCGTGDRSHFTSQSHLGVNKMLMVPVEPCVLLPPQKPIQHPALAAFVSKSPVPSKHPFLLQTCINDFPTLLSAMHGKKKTDAKCSQGGGVGCPHVHRCVVAVLSLGAFHALCMRNGYGGKREGKRLEK